VAAVLDIHHDTLYDRCIIEKQMMFSQYSQEKREKGNSYLFDKQYELAVKGDKSMLVWLGKNRLNQADRIESKVNASVEVGQKHILELPENGRRNTTTETAIDTDTTTGRTSD